MDVGIHHKDTDKLKLEILVIRNLQFGNQFVKEAYNPAVIIFVCVRGNVHILDILAVLAKIDMALIQIKLMYIKKIVGTFFKCL